VLALAFGCAVYDFYENPLGFATNMKTDFFPIVASTVILGIGVVLGQSSTKSLQYLAPDGRARVVIVPIGKETGKVDSESRIEFRSADNELLCALDYSSEDGEHGFGVVKAEWTPDSHYFVFSLSSSGGHQPWHAPTPFYSRRDGIVRELDDYFQPGISKADFQLIAPNTVRTEALEGKPVSVRLDSLPALPSRRRTKPFLADCKGGRLYRVGDSLPRLIPLKFLGQNQLYR